MVDRMSYIDSCRAGARDALIRDPENMRAAMSALQTMPRLNTWLSASLHDSGKMGAPSIETGWTIALFLSMLASGDLLLVRHPLRAGAFPDADTNRNQANLNGLHSDFVATFDPDNTHFPCDGSVRLRDSVEWSESFIRDSMLCHRPYEPRVGDTIADVVPLEVGSTNAETLYMHLVHHGGFARVPYNVPELVVFVLRDRGMLAERITNIIANAMSGAVK